MEKGQIIVAVILILIGAIGGILFARRNRNKVEKGVEAAKQAAGKIKDEVKDRLR